MTEFSQNADLWQRVAEVQPSSRALSVGRPVRRFMDSCFMRLFITVTPTAVTARPQLSGTAQRLPVPAMPSLPKKIAREIGEFPSGVLASLDGDGHPTLDRAVPEPADDGLLLPGTDARPGRASLLFHRHDELLAGQRSFVVGELVDSPRGLVLRPDGVVDGVRSTGLVALIGFGRSLRRQAQAYLDKRGLDRPQIPWHELEEIHARIDAANRAR